MFISFNSHAQDIKIEKVDSIKIFFAPRMIHTFFPIGCDTFESLGFDNIEEKSAFNNSTIDSVIAVLNSSKFQKKGSEDCRTKILLYRKKSEYCICIGSFGDFSFENKIFSMTEHQYNYLQTLFK